MADTKSPSDLDYGREVLRQEAAVLDMLARRLDDAFVAAVEAILTCPGRVVITGIGKPSIIAQKISATLASTGTPSLWLHAAEAVHGDLGRLVSEDLVIALSNSGESREITDLLDPLKRIGSSLIAMTGNSQSTLGRHADITLDMGKIEECCPMGLAPSASTTAMLALGDALAMAVLRRRDFGPEQYAIYHPGGALGRKLLKVAEVMRTGERNPIVTETATLGEALMVVIEARAGAATVVNTEGRVSGIFTDGDLRRHVARQGLSDGKEIAAETRASTLITEVMTRAPTTTTGDRLASEALHLLKERKIDEVPVVDADGRPAGMLDVQDLLDAGLV